MGQGLVLHVAQEVPTGEGEPWRFSQGMYQQQELLVQKSLTGASYWKLLAANKYHLS